MAQMTQAELEEIIGYRDKIAPCPRCEGVSVEFVFNVLDYSAPCKFTARCRSCDYTMHDAEKDVLLAKWNEAAEHARRIDYANDEQ